MDSQRDGLLLTSPAELVPVLSLRDHESVRRPFELDELRRLYRHADGEWTG